MGQDYYIILGVSATSSPDEITAAYRKLATQWHPGLIISSLLPYLIFSALVLDRSVDDRVKATEMFRKVGEAYDVLSDPEKKKLYDQSGEEGLKSVAGTGTAAASGSGPHITFRDPYKLFTDVCGTTFFPGRPNTAQGRRTYSSSNPVKDPPIVHELLISLDDLYTGTVKKMKIERTIIDEFGASTQETRIVTLEIKPGYKGGTKFTFDQHGDEAPGHIPADVVFVIKERPHPLYARDGNNLICRPSIPLYQALCGFDIPLDFLAGQTRTVRSQRVLTPGDKFTVRGGGMPISKDPGKFGDLIIDFQVKFPASLTDVEKREVVDILQDT
jgi:DnaJ family protein B protein 4